MNGILSDRHVLFSLASVAVLILVCAVGSSGADGANGNGITEIGGVISDPVPSQNGTVFRLTDYEGREIRCFSGSEIPAEPALCRLTGRYSPDGNIFFADTITFSGQW